MKFKIKVEQKKQYFKNMDLTKIEDPENLIGLQFTTCDNDIQTISEYDVVSNLLTAVYQRYNNPNHKLDVLYYDYHSFIYRTHKNFEEGFNIIN